MSRKEREKRAKYSIITTVSFFVFAVFSLIYFSTLDSILFSVQFMHGSSLAILVIGLFFMIELPIEYHYSNKKLKGVKK